MLYKRLIACIAVGFNLAVALGQTYDWTHLGPFVTPPSSVDSAYMSPTGMGWIESLHVSKDGEELYAGTITSGLFHSTDGGAHWEHLRMPGMEYGVLDLIVDKHGVFAATGLTHYEEDLGIGVLKYSSKGWDSTGLKFDPSNKEVIWALKRISKKCLLAASQSKIYRTDDKGLSWDVVFHQDALNFRQILIAQKSKKCLAAGGQLLISQDAGISWLNITDRLSFSKELIGKNKTVQRIAICEDPNIKDHFLACYTYAGYAVVDESWDGGSTWNQIYKHRRIRRLDIHHAEIAIAPGNSNVIVIGAVKSYISRNGGKDFEQMSFPTYKTPQFVHDDVRSLVLIDSLTFYMGTDGGVSKTSDGGRSWQDINGKGLTAMMIYGIGLTKEGVMVGCQDLGYFTYSDGSFMNLGHLYGDGGDALEVGNRTYTVLGGMMRVLNSETQKPIRMMGPGSRMHPFTAKLIAHPRLNDSLFYLGDHLWCFDGASWSNLTQSISNKGYKAKAFEINQKEPSTMYFAFDQPSWDNDNFGEKFLKSTDGGQSWVNITKNLGILKWRYITSISSNPDNPKELVVSLGIMDKKEVHKVYKSEDGGQSWVNYSQGLPPLETFKVEYIQGSSGILLATVNGLYYRNNHMDSWFHIDGDIPNVAIRDFEIDYESKQLYVGTYGNGLWVLKLTPEMLNK
ncbi:MAG: hypothetical protein JXR19_02685 [Bacteroidia bacterium]